MARPRVGRCTTMESVPSTDCGSVPRIATGLGRHLVLPFSTDVPDWLEDAIHVA